MTHAPGHILCWGLGKLLGWIRIWIKDHEVLNVAINLKQKALVEKYGWSEREASLFGAMIQRDTERWYEIAEHRGVPYYVYEPHPANLHQEPCEHPDDDST